MSRTGVAVGRLYFAVQAVAGAAWWIAVFTSPLVREATLGDLPPVLVGAFDIPLFVVGSVVAAAGVRGAHGVVVPWTFLVTAGLALYATATTQAGWGVVAMTAASVASLGAALLVRFGRIPAERFLIGPLGFRNARPAPTARHVAATGAQLVVFWGVFLGVIPAVIVFLEHRWRLHAALPVAVTVVGILLFVLASALGLWSALAMSTRGAGTPLPSAATTRLVVTGPYRFVRNPMAVAGIAQGVAVGLIAQSWLVVVYAIAGSVVWNTLVRPLEEADLERKFGQPYREYRDRVRCWIPRLP